MSRLINISHASSIAIHSLAIVGGSDELVNAKHISEITGFSINHIAKVLQVLVKKQYLGSDRGPKGGFRLICDPEKVNLLEIYELVEGQLSDEHCRIDHKYCNQGDCVFGDINYRLTEQFREYFTNRTLNQIIKNKQSII